MTRGTYVYRGGKVVPKHSAPPRGGPRHYVISDDLGADLEHHGYADGRRTASKSQFRQWTKQAGLIERGNDRNPARPVEGDNIRADVGRAIQMVREGYRPRILQREE